MQARQRGQWGKKIIVRDSLPLAHNYDAQISQATPYCFIDSALNIYERLQTAVSKIREAAQLRNSGVHPAIF